MNNTKKTAPKPPTKGAFKAIAELIVSKLQRKGYENISAQDLKQLIESGQPVTVVDCRDTDTFAYGGHIRGAINLPYDSFMQNYQSVPKGNIIVTACFVGYYSTAAAQKLSQSGHAKVLSLAGGMEAWDKANYPVEVEQ